MAIRALVLFAALWIWGCGPEHQAAEQNNAAENGSAEDKGVDSAQQAVTANERLQIKSMSTNKCMDVAGGFTDLGTPIVQFTCHHGPNQRFELVDTLFGFLIMSTLADNRCVGVQQPGYNALLTLMPCRDSNGFSPANVRWDLDGSDLFTPGLSHARIKSHANRNFCIDVPSGNPSDSLWLQTYGCHDGLNQKWELRNW